MADPAFERGVRDVRAGRPFPVAFDTWEVNTAWNDERGRVWAQRAPASVDLKCNGRVTDEAVPLVQRVDQDIL
jgi:hypothetical protein